MSETLNDDVETSWNYARGAVERVESEEDH